MARSLPAEKKLKTTDMKISRMFRRVREDKNKFLVELCDCGKNFD